MKHTSKVLALAVVAALGAGNANALTRAQYASALKVYFGGATATDNVLEATFLTAGGLSICDPSLNTVADPIRVWRTTANQRVVTCRVSNDHPVTAGKGFATRAAGGTGVAFHKESQGGSSNGVVPLIAVAKGQAHALQWLDVGSLPNDCTATVVAATASRLRYVDHTGCATNVLTPVDVAGPSVFDVNGGISDNEPALAYPAPGEDAALLASVPGIQILFAPPVTTALYRALQIAQFPAGPCTSDTDPAANVDSRDSSACVPSLEKQQISALYSQTIFDWNDFKDANGVALTAVPGVTPPADEFVRICRRVAASGTQATFEALFLNQRCASGVTGFAVPDDTSTIDDTVNVAPTFGAGSLVNTNPSSGNVRACMSAANAGNFWGLGVLSTEVKIGDYGAGNATTPPGGTGFRFVAINGAAPNLTNAANGSYAEFSENTVNRVKDGGVGAVTGQRLAIVELVSNRLGNVAALAAINADFSITAPWGQGGVLALPTTANPNTAPYSVADLASDPIGTQTRSGNTCNLPAMAKPQPVDNR